MQVDSAAIVDDTEHDELILAAAFDTDMPFAVLLLILQAVLNGIFYNGLQHKVEHLVIKLAFLNVVFGIKAIVMGQLLDTHIRLDVFQLRTHRG